MSLQVWLPLNGDLHNQGLNNITITNNGATVNNNGKIGKCYQFGTAASDILIPATAMTSFTTECSICFWIKILSWNTSYATFFQAGTSSAAWTAYIFGLLRNNANSTCCFSISDTSASSGANYLTPTLELNTWYHLGLIYKTGHCLIYINGQLYQDYATSIVPKFDGINVIRIGRCANGSSYQTNCLLNDFCIYNHALSAAEVEELSKGLVLHYKLDDSYFQHSTNLMPNYLDMNLGSANASTGTWRLAGSNTMTKSRVQINDSPEGLCYGFQNAGIQTPNDGSCYGIDSFPLEANTIYTISMWARITEGTEAYAGYNIYSLSEELGGSHLNIQKNYRVTQLPSNGDWIKCWYTFKTNSSSTRNIYIGIVTGDTDVTTQMCCIHIEKVDNTVDNIIYDSSGYNYNSTIIGQLAIVQPSPKFDCANYMNNTSTSNHIECNDEITLPIDNITVSLWVKANKSTNQVIFASPQIEFGILNNLGYCNPNGNQAGWTLNNFITNEWNHIVIIRQNSTYKLYINNILETQNGAQNNYNHNKNVLWLLNRGNNNTYAGNASISDFRIYATALTAAQVKELYRTSMIVDGAAIRPRDLE